MGIWNWVKLTILLAFLTGLFVLAGRFVGGTTGMLVAFCLAMVMNLGAWWFSDRLALSMTRAHEVTSVEMPELFSLVSSLARRADLPTPRVYVIDTPTPNAFATGRSPRHAAVAVTTGLLEVLRPDELAGVIGHELAHIRNRDTLLSSVVATIAGAVTMLAEIGQWSLLFGGQHDEETGDAGSVSGMIGAILMLLLAPIAALLIQLAISRAREYHADAVGAEIAGDPLALARALQTLDDGNALLPLAVRPAVAHLFIVQPLTGRLGALFSTHPPTHERIARLRAMAMPPRRRSAYAWSRL